MPVSADSYEAKVMANAITMLGGSAAFRAAILAITGTTVADATAAKAFIIESWGGDAQRDRSNQAKVTFADGTTKLPPQIYALIDLDENGVEVEEDGIGVDTYNGIVMITIYVPRKLTGETPAESIRRARNLQGAVRTEIRAQFGSANCLARGTCKPGAVIPPDAEGADGESILIPLDLIWYA